MIHIINYTRRSAWLLILALVFSISVASHAATPGNIDYQGYLTDSAGSPSNGTLNITFSLYNVESGGVSLWTDSQSVTVTNGLFNVKLGRAGNPFPLGLFDSGLWIGIDVAGDGEMSPRAGLSSAGFAHKANDADTVGGITPGSLLQSSDLTTHTANAGAHHNKTTSFTELGDQVLDAQIPSKITRDDELIAHTINPNAHHPRFTTGEAVAAMGPAEDFNSLNHVKRTDAQVFAAVRAQDGAGSMLDADMLDGLQANEIIEAAQSDVRTPISSLPFTITQPGSYYLTGNLTSFGAGIVIEPVDVTLDLMGFTIDGNGGGGVGIEIFGGAGITIKNGTIQRFSGFGIHGYSVNNIKIKNIKVYSNGSGIELVGESIEIDGCVAWDNGQFGIFVGDHSRVTNSVAHNNVNGITAGIGAMISLNMVYNNMGHGIAGFENAVITKNNVNNNGYVGIMSGPGSTVSENKVAATSGVGIVAEPKSTISNNTVTDNMGLGIEGFSSNTIVNNTVNNNNNGIRVNEFSRVEGNTLDANGGIDISVSGFGNTIENNFMKNTGAAIVFDFNGNFYANNRAYGPVSQYVGTAGQTDGGGNISFF